MLTIRKINFADYLYEELLKWSQFLVNDIFFNPGLQFVNWRPIYHGSTMLMVHAGGAIRKRFSYLDKHTIQEFSLPKITNVTPGPLSFPSQPSSSKSEGLKKCFLSKQDNRQLKGLPRSPDSVTKRWLVMACTNFCIQVFCKLPRLLVADMCLCAPITVPVSRSSFIWWWIPFIHKHCCQLI